MSEFIALQPIGHVISTVIDQADHSLQKTRFARR